MSITKTRKSCSISWLMIVLLCTVNCHVFLSDTKLAQNFIRQRRTFTELLVLAQSDYSYRHIHNDIGPNGLDQSKMIQYRRLFNQLGVQIGINRYAEFPKAIFFATDGESVQGGAFVKGYAFCDCNLEPRIQDTAARVSPALKDSDGEHFLVFKLIETNWYIFWEFGNGQLHGRREQPGA